MRNKLTLIPLALFSILVMFSSCEKNCGTCGPLQTCQSGTCQCTQGLEGPNCDIKSVEKFEGTYNVYESYNPAFPIAATQPFTCNMQRSQSLIDRIWFDNFAGLGLQVYGVVNTVYITIPDQTVGGTEVSGQGTFNTATRRMDLKYQISSSGYATVATSTYQHQ